MGNSGVAAPVDLTDEPAALATAARAHLRDRFLRAKVAISGANFAVAATGSLVVVESEGNGRMCLTLAETLISVVGIDKVIPSFGDLEVFLQLLARSATGERMNPYTSIWTGVHEGDGPREVHLVLVDNGRTRALADPVGREALRCIRCAACLNVCPVYERVGGHAYGSVYPGPIGAVLAPQLDHVVTDPVARALPFASTLCGACFEVCPVRIDIPRLLVHLRGEVVDHSRRSVPRPEAAAMSVMALVFSSARRLAVVERLTGVMDGRRLTRLPGTLHHWTDARDAPTPARQSFRAWWAARPGAAPAQRVTRVAVSSRRRPIASRVRDEAPAPTSERAAVLQAIARARKSAPARRRPVVRDYHRAGSGIATAAERLSLFISRLEDYKATVTVVERGGVASAVVAALARRGCRSVVVPADLDPGWLDGWGGAGGPEVVVDDGSLTARDLDAIDATVSAAALAIADTGTIVLDAGVGQGRRILSLVPDHLVVVLRADQLCASVPDALAAVSARSPQTWISGPSATSDIELSRVEGVHGPRVLEVIIEAE
jgi:L-lactate utilization protein LutB